MEESNRFLEIIIQTIHEPLLVLDSHMQIVQANEAFTQLSGLAPVFAKRMPLESALNLGWNESELRIKLQKVLHTNNPLENFEHQVQLKNSDRRIFLVNARKFRTKQDSPPLLLMALEDITIRKDAEAKMNQANEQLQRLNDELEERVGERTRELSTSNKQLETFCYSIAHDLRAPLRSMAGFGSALLEDFSSKLGNDGSGYVGRIVSASQHMESMIHDLLEYGRFTTVAFETRTVDAEDALQEVLKNLSQAIKEKHAVIERKNRLPKVLGHKLVLETALTNLLANAFKFAPAQKKPHITIWSEQHDKHVRIWIEDKGIGIEPCYHKKIFEVFQRLHSQEAYPGTGIGLAIVQRALQRIGGNVGVESQLGDGSRFWISLPRAE